MTNSARSATTGILRGLAQHCPNCGKGKLFRAYLKPAERCGVCDHELGAYRADDGPAYFTILIVGHLIVAPLLFLPWVWEASPWVTVPGTLIPLALVTLFLLPRVKGGFIGLLWSHRALEHHRDHAPDGELDASRRRP